MSPASQDPEITLNAITTTTSRQQSGLACEQCRARKSRCDRVKPQCGGCKDMGVECAPTVRRPRGPKKGHFKAMQSRLSALEAVMGSATHAQKCVQPASLHSSTDSGSALQTEDDDIMDARGARSMSVTYSEVGPVSPPPSDPNDHQSLQWHPTAGADPMVGVLDPGNDFPMTMMDQATMPDYFSYDLDLDSNGISIQAPDFVGLCGLSSTAPKPCSRSSMTTQASSWQFSSSLPVSPALTPTGQETLPLSALVKADLNHLYFDRIHESVPLLNKKRFLARSSRPKPSLAFQCLQHAMWTLAATTSSQFQHIQTPLYSQTRKLLEALEWDTVNDSMNVEQAQSWALLAIYEMTQINYQRGWLSAGRCFRLVQLNKLHLIDCPKNGAISSGLTWTELEEQRRTFWIAYSLDRFISLTNQLPMMLNEQIVTRLPAPETAFQRGRPVEMAFLSQAMTDNGGQASSRFIDSIVLVTISGRCSSHPRNDDLDRLSSQFTEELRRRHQLLDRTLSLQMAKILAATDDEENTPNETMLLFTTLMALATSLSQYTNLSSGKQSVELPTNATRTDDSKAFESVHHIVNLAQRLAEFSWYKVHPLTPMPLMLCAEFARERMSMDLSFQPVFHAMCNTLQELSPINHLAQVCLGKLGHGVQGADNSRSIPFVETGFP